jgi:N-acyl-D-amino-acid deacylase
MADLLIFDPARVDDAATYENPHQLAEGFADILVNGQWARRDNQFTSTLAGRVVVPDRR